MAFEALRERWERVETREKRMFSLLGVTFVVCIFGFIGMQISSGLSDREAHNAATRSALRLIELRAADPGAMTTDPAEAAIGETAPQLGSYLEGIGNELSISIPEQQE